MLQFVFAIILLAFFLYSLRSLFSALRGAEKWIAYFLVGSAYIILTLELASLFSWLDKPLAVLAIQFVITTAAFWIFRKQITLPSMGSVSTFFGSLVTQIKRHPYLTAFTSLIAAGYGFLFFLSIHFPQNTGDSLYNHLSRIGYWLQQGSLKPYNGFNTIGTTYPYNNSLLMLWSVLFIRSDVLVGTVQFIATIACALIIYAIAIEMGFENKRSLIAALIFLTFPIILFQSITAQNDTLAASFIGAAFLFMLKAIRNDSKVYLILSALGYSLALGTKQYALFALPGYLALVITAFLRRKNRLQRFTTYIPVLFVFTLLVGSYTYIQNVIYHHKMLGEVQDVNYDVIVNPPKNLIMKAVTNSARLFTQFISCEGLTPDLEQGCMRAKASVFTPVFINQKINIESNNYLLEQDTPFSMTIKYALNEESAWFGLISWMLILPAIVYGFIFSIKRKRIEFAFLILSCLIFFVAVASFKNGWDPFLGRHLIIFVVLLMPFTTFIFSQKKLGNKILLGVICPVSFIIGAYSVVNNVSRPLVGEAQFYRNKFVVPVYGDVAYKFIPFFPNLDNVWNLTRIELRAFGDRSLVVPLELVQKYIPKDATLGIIARQGYFYDYLFFGESFKQKIIPVKNGDISRQPDFEKAEYLLITPDYASQHPFGFKQIAEQDQWRILKRIR